MIHNSGFAIHLPGLFNIENALAAVCVGLSENISLEKMAGALGKIEGVPGRLEYIPNNKGLEIIVDYAVTPDSLQKLYELIGAINEARGRVIAVFGSCGERDRGKRPLMGEIVSKAADYTIITNEDPYHEDPQQIIDEVANGVPICPERRVAESKDSVDDMKIPRQARDNISCFTENIDFWRIMDRREAIKKALALAKAGDFVVVTGKGAEETMAVGDQRIPWNDKKVILEELTKME